MPGRENANSVLVIDNSASMKSNGYVAITKRCSKAFVTYALPGDGLGVVRFEKTAGITQPFAIVDLNRSQVNAAVSAIDDLKFNGDKTAIGLGLQAAEGMLNSQLNPRGVVLMSDGFNNAGPAPLTVLPSGYPVYSCAMGKKADVDLMQEIATRTNGQYFNAPYPATMMFIFNQIRGLLEAGIAKLVTNKQDWIQQQGFQLVQAPISGANRMGQFGVVWDDDSLSYTASPNPSKSQISITLFRPDFSDSGIAPVAVGDGYVLFNVPSLQSGLWNIQVFSGSKSAIQFTSAAFELPKNPEGAAHLVVSAPDSLVAGTPLSLHARVVENGKAIDGVNVRAEVMHPTISMADAIAANREALQNIALTEEDREDGAPEEQVRFAKLQTWLLPSQDILGHRTFNVMLAPTKLGEHTATIDTPTPGSYNINIIATGTPPETNTVFQRSHLVTVHVDG